MVDWGLFLLAARWSAAFLSASRASVVAASRSCGSALLVSWLCPGTCFQPCLWFIRQCIDVADLEGLWGASGALAAASVYMFHDLSKPAAAAALASAFEFTAVLVGDLLCLVGAFTVPFVSEIWLAAGVLNYVHVSDGVCALVGAFWCLDGDIGVYCSSSSSTAAVCISSLCAFVGISPFLEGILAHVLVGVYSICGCNSSGTGMVPHSSCSAFACDFPLFDGVIEFACVLSILKLGGLWFLAGPFQKAKEFVSRGNSRSLSLQASGPLTANIDESLVKGSGEHGIVSSLPEGLGQASGRVDVPDDAKIAAAAAIEGTLRSGPGSLDALGLARSREGKIQFFSEGS